MPPAQRIGRIDHAPLAELFPDAIDREATTAPFHDVGDELRVHGVDIRLQIAQGLIGQRLQVVAFDFVFARVRVDARRTGGSQSPVEHLRRTRGP